MKMLINLLFSSILFFGCTEFQRAEPKFNVGDRVRLVVDPRYNNGIIYRIWCGQDVCVYDTRFGLYSIQGMIASELELVRK